MKVSILEREDGKGSIYTSTVRSWNTTWIRQTTHIWIYIHTLRKEAWNALKIPEQKP